ncbi:hypothetical protein [Anabaena azotica]|uniref:Uncharacterized protein n=1 Tax=Anabaena azotica FACHB-119 TaxID=947527 RepID=A0ABR8D0Y6_9NOST|nr:hypothetical protein [Anabaena azotica]MBD2499895.1 hypothetical protein [Anabaena azotica FACHB-119]
MRKTDKREIFMMERGKSKSANYVTLDGKNTGKDDYHQNQQLFAENSLPLPKNQL